MLGRRGERLAERLLKGKGLRLLARNYRTPFGELDLVMRSGKTIVFVEVKTLRSQQFDDPESRVTPGKQRKLLRAATAYLRQKRLDERPARFDVVAVLLEDERSPELTHHEAAFMPR